MITTAVIAFREFLEAFLIVGVFFGISKRLNLHKEMEIGAAALTGVAISLLLTLSTYVFGNFARGVLTEQNADILQSYLLIFSGIFISYVAFSLHGLLRKGRGSSVLMAHKKMQQHVFDVSLFFTIVFLVMREGFEIALFTASVSLFSAFIQNFWGLIAGLLAAAAVGMSTFVASIRFPIAKVLKATEYMIVVLGASLTQNGITILMDKHFHVSLSGIGSFHLSYLPEEGSVIGHLLGSFLGIDRDFSAMRLCIMAAYAATVYMVFLRKKKSVTVPQ